MVINYQELDTFAREKILNNGRWNYPFRNRYYHTLRVIKWAERLQKVEGGDWEIIKLACFFHDTGWDETISHNIVSRNIAADYLKEIGYDPEKTKRVLEAVEYHCLRDSMKELNLESYIVMDADILDEVGATSIIWDAMATACGDNPSYIKAYQRIKKYTQDIKRKERYLKTDTGKKFYRGKIDFIDSFIKELEFELF